MSLSRVPCKHVCAHVARLERRTRPTGCRTLHRRSGRFAFSQVFLAGAPWLVIHRFVVGRVLFETLWFRVTGLTLGNSMLASNIVLASFMAGLGAGNAIAARYGKRLRRPLQFYAVIEGIVGLTGLAIVVLMPPLSPTLGRLFTHVVAHAWLVNPLRVTVAFSLMIVPATAMGLTLPLLAKAITRGDGNLRNTVAIHGKSH